MVNSGMLSREEAEALSNSRASSSYEASRGTSEFAGQENSVMDLKSALSNLITRVSTAAEGEFLPEHVEIAKSYQAQLEQGGGIQNANLSRESLNVLLGEANQAYQHNPSALEGEYGLLVETAAPIQEGTTDEQLAEEYAASEKASRSSEKEYDPQDHIIVNEATNQAYYRDESGQLQVYHSPGSEEGMLLAEAESNQAFLDSDGQQSGMFDNLTEK